VTGWVLRLDDGGWWNGQGRGATADPLDAAWFSDPTQARRAMAAVGWPPCGPGWIEPLRVAVARTAPHQLSLLALA
jgi:hypothetical protein